MKRILICAALVLSSQAFAGKLDDQFWQAHQALVKIPMQKMSLAAGKALNDAQRRALEFASETSQVSNLVFAATSNPTYDAQIKACQAASRALDVGVGARFLNGFGELAAEFQAFSASLGEVRRALECENLWSAGETCSMFANRAFHSEFVAYNGTAYQAHTEFWKHDGFYDAVHGVKGDFNHIRCKDGGLTMSGHWQTQGGSGWFNFYILDTQSGEFKGSWGDFRGKDQFYQGSWNGRYK